MQIISFIGCGLIGAALCIVLRKYRPEFTAAISLVTGIIILGAAVSSIKPLFETIFSLSEISGINTLYVEVLVKAIAVCYITQLASDTCNDAGEGAIAAKIQFAGKCSVLLISIPVIDNLIDVIKSIISL